MDEAVVGVIEATMITIDDHQDTQDLHLPDVAARPHARTTAAPHQDAMLIPTFLVAVIVMTVGWTGADVVVHHLCDQSPAQGHLRLFRLIAQGIEMRSRRGKGLVGTHLVDLLPLYVEDMAEIEDEEVQGAVIELDPLHPQIPLTHDLPEDLEGGAMVQYPHAAALHRLGADAPLHLCPDLVLVLVQ